MKEEQVRLLIGFLTERGYSFNFDAYDEYGFIEMLGNGIRGGFVRSGAGYHPRLDGHVFADNSICFNKVTQCPLCLPMPTSIAQRAYLLNRLEFWASVDGLKLSTEFRYEKWESEYPKEVR